MERIIDKSIKLDLTGLNGNAFALMGAFQKQARREGWTPEEIKAVLDEAKSHDYDYLRFVLSNHCEANNTDRYDEE